MQLFSRKKALVALSLGALTALGACGDDVTVPVAPDPVVVISITPPSATMNIGESLNFAVQITGGSSTTPPTLSSCTSSNTAVATAAVQAGACRVTAIASGNITVTATSSTNQSAAASITVAPAAAAINTLTTSPTTAGLSVGQTLTIVPNVNKAAASVAVTYAYASSNAAIASVNATSGVVTAVAPGTATITVTANGSGTGYTTTALTAGVTVNVSAAPPSISGLTVQPSELLLAVGGTAQLSASVTQPAGAPAATITYTSLTPAVATVSATGVVTGVAEGSSSIEVKATSAGSATLAATTLTQLVAVNVRPPANASVVAILQGPTVTTSLDSAYSVSAGSSTNTPIGPQQGVIAGIRYAANGQLDQSVDILNVKDQIQVDVGIEPNGQRISALHVFLCDIGQGAPTAACSDPVPAAIQTFANNTPNAGTIRVRINTAEFTVNTTAGTATARHINSRYVVRVQLRDAAGAVVATSTDERSILNFNNIDNFALAHTRPLNSANDANGRTWWGGPTTSDIGQPSGVGTFRLYPVIYTNGRSIQSVNATFGRCLGFGAAGLPNSVTDTSLPFDFSYGTATAGAAFVHISCTGIVGAHDLADQFRLEDFPMVASSLDNTNNNGPRNIYAYNPSYNTDAFGGPRPTLYRFGTLQPVTEQVPVRVDYQAPTLTLAVTQSNGERWVNDPYAFSTNYTASDFSAFPAVGLFTTASRNTLFRAASANVCAGGQTFTDIPNGRLAIIADIPAAVVPPNREHPCDFTNNAFVAQATETDRLGNRGTIGNLASGTTPASPLFGIDNTAPEIQTAWDGSGPIPDMPNHYLATGDSIFQPASATVAATPTATAGNATDFWFGVRYRDSRSGFNIANHGTRTVKRYAPNATPLVSNVAVVTTVDSRTMNFGGGTGNPVETQDPTFRRDSITVYGRGGLSGTSGSQNLAVASNLVDVGYYQYDLTLTDRALNTSTFRQRSAVDRTSPQITGVLIPAVLGATATGTAIQQAFIPTGTDDVEAFDADLFLRYPAFNMVGDSSIGSTVAASTARLKFRRERGGQPGFANFHNPWQVFSDTLLSTPFGPGAALSSAGMLMPIPTIRGIEPVDTTDAPVAWGVSGAVNPFAGFKPNLTGLYAYDVRASHRAPATPFSRFPVPYATGCPLNCPFNNLGQTNTFPGIESAYLEPIFAGNVANGSRWDVKDLNASTATPDLIVTWAGFAVSGSSVQVRVTTGTVVTQPPFPQVHLFKWEPDVHHTGTGIDDSVSTTLSDSVQGNWVYITSINSAGAPSNPSLFDQGSTRFWTYTLTFANHNIGALTQGGTTGGCYRAVGTDISGDGIVTRSFGSGCPVGAPVVGGTAATITARSYGNGTGTISTDLRGTILTKGSLGNFTVRTSANRPAGLETFTFNPTGGSSIQSAPTGCTLLGAPVFPSAAAVSCTYDPTNGPRTITVIFENPAGGV
jgi:uncharacterized protein YjdB